MNIMSYRAFKSEIEKRAGAGSALAAIGSGVSQAAKWAWKHPKATIGIGLGIAAIPHIVPYISPAMILGSERTNLNAIKSQNEAISEILRNTTPQRGDEDLENIPIETPLY